MKSKSSYLPEYIDPYRYAEQGIILEGVVAFAKFTRLPEDLKHEAHDVSVALTFGVDEQKTVFLKGHLETHIHLQCQRCLEPMVYEIMTDFTLGIVKSLEEAKKLPKAYEPVLIEEGQLAVWALVEDELLLNLPLVPRHEIGSCAVKTPVRESGVAEEGLNPFVVLKTLKEIQ